MGWGDGEGGWESGGLGGLGGWEGREGQGQGRLGEWGIGEGRGVGGWQQWRWLVFCMLLEDRARISFGRLDEMDKKKKGGRSRG